MANEFKSGFVTFIGRPNVGKSTLMNRLIGQKIAITSNKPQTTRNRIQTVYTDERGQIIFLDTPGIHKAKNKLANAHFTRLCELLKIIQTLYSHLYLVSIQILFSIYSTIIPIILYCFWVFQVFYRHFRDLKMQTTKNKSEILEQCPIQCFAVDFI